jgi:hypothetical protein
MGITRLYIQDSRIRLILISDLCRPTEDLNDAEVGVPTNLLT